jgi:hypothetical protein
MTVLTALVRDVLAAAVLSLALLLSSQGWGAPAVLSASQEGGAMPEAAAGAAAEAAAAAAAAGGAVAEWAGEALRALTNRPEALVLLGLGLLLVLLDGAVLPLLARLSTSPRVVPSSPLRRRVALAQARAHSLTKMTWMAALCALSQWALHLAIGSADGAAGEGAFQSFAPRISRALVVPSVAALGLAVLEWLTILAARRHSAQQSEQQTDPLAELEEREAHLVRLLRDEGVHRWRLGPYVELLYGSVVARLQALRGSGFSLANRPLRGATLAGDGAGVGSVAWVALRRTALSVALCLGQALALGVALTGEEPPSALLQPIAAAVCQGATAASLHLCPSPGSRLGSACSANRLAHVLCAGGARVGQSSSLAGVLTAAVFLLPTLLWVSFLHTTAPLLEPVLRREEAEAEAEADKDAAAAWSRVGVSGHVRLIERTASTITARPF